MAANIDIPPKSQRPTHVAVIMDGNGRWAEERGLPRLEGHRRGADVVREITTYCRELEIPYLTLFSFSTENWRRPTDEVMGLMQLLEDYCARERDTLMKNRIRLNLIGGAVRLPSSTRTALQGLIAETAHNDRMTLTLAIDYGGREEIARAARGLVADVQAGRLAAEDIDEGALGARLDTANMPEPDLMVRTSGEMRVSNFLLWQMAYAELYFTPVRWPDVTRADFAAAIREYACRQRRFGATGGQIVGLAKASGESF